jgi:hypothetical protein
MDMKSDSAAKLFTLRRLMVERGIDVYSKHTDSIPPDDLQGDKTLMN